MPDTLYQRLKGEAGIRAAVDRFYEKVLADPMLAPFFADVDMAKQRRHQFLFLSAATGGPGDYAGRDMAAAHTGLGLTDANFDRVCELLLATLGELGVPQADLDEVVAVLGPLRADIVTS